MPIVLVSLPILTAECADTKGIQVDWVRRKCQWQSHEATGRRSDCRKDRGWRRGVVGALAMKDERLAEVARRRVLRLSSSFPLWAKNF